MDIKEDKKPQLPKKPVIFYYVIVLLVLAAVNLFLVPTLSERSIQEASYDEFLDDLESGKISEVNLDTDTIYYLEKTEAGNRYIRPAVFLILMKWSVWIRREWFFLRRSRRR